MTTPGAPFGQPPYGQPALAKAPAPSPVPPGWYPGPSGVLQWWDGQAWGPTVPPTADNTTTTAMFCYLGLLVIGFLAPLIILLTEGKKSRFVRHHATEALNWAITAALLSLALVALYVVALVLGVGAGVSTGDGTGVAAGFGVVVVLIVVVVIVGLGFGVTSLVFTIIGAVKANQRRYWRYPFAIRLVKGAATRAEVDALNR